MNAIIGDINASWILEIIHWQELKNIKPQNSLWQCSDTLKYGCSIVNLIVKCYPRNFNQQRQTFWFPITKP